MTQIVLTSEETDEYESRLSKKAAEALEVAPELESGRPLVQHIQEDFFAMYPDGQDYGITMNVEAEGRRNYSIVFAEDGAEVSADHYYDTFEEALRQLAEMEA